MDSLWNILTRQQQQGVALDHFNIADLQLLKAVVAAAVGARVPMIVGASEESGTSWGRMSSWRL